MQDWKDKKYRKTSQSGGGGGGGAEGVMQPRIHKSEHESIELLLNMLEGKSKELLYEE